MMFYRKPCNLELSIYQHFFAKLLCLEMRFEVQNVYTLKLTQIFWEIQCMKNGDFIVLPAL